MMTAVAGPFILLTFQIVFQTGSYQYWGDKYHSVLSSQYLFSRIAEGSLIGPLWREDLFSGNIWQVSLGTVPFMADIVAARLLRLSPFGIDLASNLFGYTVAVMAMFLYLRRVLALTESGAAVSAVLFATSGYLLSVWTGCANDWLTTGLLPALLFLSHQLKAALDTRAGGRVLVSWGGVSLLVYASAAASSLKTLPILMALVSAYALFVLRSIPSTFLVFLAMGMGLVLYSPWLWLSWEGARISQRMVSAFVPTAPFDPISLAGQVLVVVKRIASGFNVYGVSIPVVLIVTVSLLGYREILKRQTSAVKAVLQFSVAAYAVCFAMDAFALQVNDLKKEIPLVNGFDVVRFEWFASFFGLVPVAWMLDNGMCRPGAEGGVGVRAPRVRLAVAVTGGAFVLQAGYLALMTMRVPSVIYPQNIVLYVYVLLFIAAAGGLLALVYRRPDGAPGSGRAWCLWLIALSVLLQSSVIGYRHGVDGGNRANGDEPIMTYAERFSIPDDIAMLRDVNRSDDRVVDLTRPYDRVLSTAASTALPLAGLRTPIGYANLFPSWYDRFVSRAVNGSTAGPSRWVEIQPGPGSNYGVLKLLGVKYVLASGEFELPGYEPLRWHESTRKVLYAAGAEVGPAFMSAGRVCASNDREALDMIHAADYEALVSRAVLVSSDPSAQPLCKNQKSGEDGRHVGQAVPARLSVQRGQDRVSLQIESETGGVLTLADVYYPGWQAYLDGAQAPILRTYTTLRGVLVTPGRHTVEFVFSPSVFWKLLWLSNSLLVVLIVCVAWVTWKGSRSPVEAVGRLYADTRFQP